MGARLLGHLLPGCLPCPALQSHADMLRPSPPPPCTAPLLPQVVQLFDSWAHHLSPDQFAEFSLPYAERIIAAVRAKYPHVPLIFHGNGGTGKLGIMRGSTADVLGLDWACTMADARAELGNRTLQVRPRPHRHWPQLTSHSLTVCCCRHSAVATPGRAPAAGQLTHAPTPCCCPAPCLARRATWTPWCCLAPRRPSTRR